ncbi:MAG: DUF945 domain-containing protein [Patescibacteria group bacterium]|nr:DUF945 domain-containing protein [Patescibacteria group bacterium]
MNQVFSEVEGLRNLIGGLDTAEVRDVEVSNQQMQPYIAIWNTSKDNLETITERKNSTLIQHQEAFNPFLDAISQKSPKISGTLKNHGGEVIIEVLFGNLFIKDPDGEGNIQLGARLVNSYNTRSGPHFRGEAFGFRSMCSNGMIFGKVLAAVVTSKHTKISELQKQMMEFVGQIFDKSIELQELIKKAGEERLDEYEAEAILEKDFRSNKLRKKLQDSFESKDNITRYTVYNAITSYATFGAKNESHRVRLQQIAQKVLKNPKSNEM